MKCRGDKCSSFWDSDHRTWCDELNTYVFKGSECCLPKNIRDTRDELLRKCELLEELLDNIDEKLGDLIDKMED